jgi:hypothetical protein
MQVDQKWKEILMGLPTIVSFTKSKQGMINCSCRFWRGFLLPSIYSFR